MALSANLKTALATTRGPVWLAEVTLPDGVQRYHYGDGYVSLGRGHYEGRLLSFSPVSEAASEPTGQMQALQLELELEDTDRTLAMIAEGEDADEIRGGAVALYMGHRDCVFADWAPIFSGVISQDFEWVGDFKAKIVARTNDLPFRSQFPGGCWTIGGVEWPNALPENFAKTAPLIYGIHDSLANTEDGMVPALRVGLGVYMLAAGWLKSVDRVYADTVPVSSASYTVTHPVVGGKLFTCVEFTSDPGADVLVTADVQGYETVGDGSGTLITDPVDQLAHISSNFIVGDPGWRNGPWLATDAVIDATTFATTFFSARAYSGSRRISERMTGYDLLAEWAASHEARLRWTGAGKIAVGVIDPTITTIYQDDPWLQWWAHMLGPFSKAPTVQEQIAHHLIVSYVYGEAAGEYLQQLAINDPQAPNDAATETFEQPWSNAA